jgi:tripartite-type tricarboxylate transporter receptor subunit TctC
MGTTIVGHIRSAEPFAATRRLSIMKHVSAGVAVRDLAHILGFILLIAAGTPSAAAAQEWPSKQAIKLVVPFGAGSATDLIARTVFEQVGKQIGQTVVVENRGGAGTTLGAAMVAKAEPDGYTLLVNSTSHVVVASTYTHVPYSVENDFAAISTLADSPFVVAAATKYKTLNDLIEAGKKPGANILFGSSGSSGQLFMEQFRFAANFAGTNVPFRGTPEAMTEVVTGRIDMFPAPAPSAIALTRDGKVNSLAVSSGKRSPLLPTVPTMAEAGLPNAAYNFWVGAFAPAKTPKAIVERLNREIVAALAVTSVADKIVTLGGTPMPMTSSDFTAFVRKEIAVNAAIVKASGFPIK